MEADDLLDQLDDDYIAPLDQGNTSVEVVQPEYSGRPAERPMIDVMEHVNRATSVTDEVLSSWRSDRCEAQSAANFVKGILDNIIASGERPSAGMVEQYIKALEVKANTNQTAVRCIDGITKLLSATKPGTQVQNNNLVVGNREDLIEALKRPVVTEDP